MLTRIIHVLALALMIPLVTTEPAWAHAQEGVAGGLVSGFLHPLFGPDHVVAMVAVGLWGAQLRAPAIWVLPITFPTVMSIGGVLGVLGVPIPFTEIGIALSAVVLGLMVATVARPPLWVAAVLVGVFAIFHGYAHGTELPNAVNPLAYGIGFVVSTGLLHLCGIAIGLAMKWPLGAQAVRVCGGLIAVAGLYYLLAGVGMMA